MATHVEVRQAIGPAEAGARPTQGLRDGFLIDRLFMPSQARLTLSHLGRVVIGGIAPDDAPLELGPVPEAGTASFWIAGRRPWST